MAFKVVYADVNIEYGGVFIEDHGDYAEIVEVVDLDSAAGASGLNMIQQKSIGIYSRSLRENVKRLQDALECQGWTDRPMTELRKIPRENRRLLFWEALSRYWGGDVENTTILQTEEDADRRGWDGWRPDESEGVVTDLRAWLDAKFDLDWKVN